MEPRKKTGNQGEDYATRHLGRRGWDILDRNLRIGGVEIDILARDGDTHVLVEVRTRHGATHGDGAESITPAKAQRLRRAAMAYFQTLGTYCDLRIDVIAVDLSPPDGPALQHIENAVTDG